MNGSTSKCPPRNRDQYQILSKILILYKFKFSVVDIIRKTKHSVKMFLSIILGIVFFGSITNVSSHTEGFGVLDTGESIDGPLSRVFIISGMIIFLFILASAIWLLRREKSQIKDPQTYGEKIDTFGRNARLYILHIQGMSLTYGVRTVLYNIFLLYVFSRGVHMFGTEINAIAFIGILLAIGSIISGIMAPFNGIVVDKIGKKWSFIMGDFFGAMMILLVVIFPIAWVVLVAQIFRSAVMSIHSIAEGPFIYEQSTEKERVHLFSVSSGFSTLASMSGNLLGGIVPLGIAILFFQTITVTGSNAIFVLQIGLVVSVILWLLSLVPAFFLKEDPKLKERSNQYSVSARFSFDNVSNWKTIGVFVISSLFIGFGAGLFVQYFSVFFLVVFDASPAEIGIIMALGSLFIAGGNFISPILAENFGKVKMIVSTRAIGSLFIFIIPFAPILSLAGIFYLFRALFFNSTMPTEAALAMEAVNDAERTTMEALRMGASSIFSAVGYFLGGYLMGIGDFITPFMIAGTLYLISVLIFWLYFRNEEEIIVKTDSKTPIATAGS